MLLPQPCSGGAGAGERRPKEGVCNGPTPANGAWAGAAAPSQQAPCVSLAGTELPLPAQRRQEGLLQGRFWSRGQCGLCLLDQTGELLGSVSRDFRLQSQTRLEEGRAMSAERALPWLSPATIPSPHQQAGTSSGYNSV